MEVVWFVVVWFLVWQLVCARNGMGEYFLVMLCNQKEACLQLRLGGYLIAFVSFKKSDLRCLLR